MGDRENSDSGQGKKSWDRQVVGDMGHNSCQFNQQGHKHESEIIVIDISFGKPGIVRGKTIRLDDRIEICKVHGLFPAHKWVPQIRITKADL